MTMTMSYASCQSGLFNQRILYEDTSRTPEYRNFRSATVNMLSNIPTMDQVVTQPLTSWTKKDPRQWTKTDVLDWLYWTVEQEGLDGSKFQGEVYKDFVGYDLCKMDREQFQKVDPCYGGKIFDMFQNLLTLECKPRQSTSIPDNFLYSNNNSSDNCKAITVDVNNNGQVAGLHIPKSVVDNICENHCSPRNDNDLMVFQTGNDINVDLPSLGVYSISQEIELPLTGPFNLATKIHQQPQTAFPLLTFTAKETSGLSFIKPEPVTKLLPYPMVSLNTYKKPARPVPLIQSPSFANPSTSLSLARTESLSSLPQRSAPSNTSENYDQGYSSEDSSPGLSFMPPFGDQPSDDVFITDDPTMGINDTWQCSASSHTRSESSSRKDGKLRNVVAKSGNHLWEFVLQLLRDPNTNPKLLRWEDKNSGVFRFVQSEKVAKLWGEKKNNPQMTYEKLSRAMRFCRTAGYFERVPKTGRFPKKLCFMFGGKAHGWKE